MDARGDDVGERVGDGDTDDSDQIYISIPEVSGMSLQRISLFRCTTIKLTTKKTV